MAERWIVAIDVSALSFDGPYSSIGRFFELLMSTILVTGAAGFIGSHLSAGLLNAGHTVVGIDNFDPFYARSIKEANLRLLTSPNFSFSEADVRDRDRMMEVVGSSRPAAVIHLAALAGVRPSLADPARYVSVNVDGLAAMLDAMRDADCRTFLFASSSSVYGNAARVPFAEDDRVDEPISPYAATKAAGELLCRVYAARYGFSISALRFFTVFGPAQRPDLAISLFMKKIARGEEIPMFGDGATSRDYTYIDDIVSGVQAALDRTDRAEPGFFRIYNVGGSQPVMLRDMIDEIAEVVGRPAIIRREPEQPGDVRRTWADLSRSGVELGYQPQTSFRQGLERQWSWMKDGGLALLTEAASGA